MTNLDKVAISDNCKFGGGGVFATLRQTKLSENANKSFHVYKVTVALHVCNKILVSDYYMISCKQKLKFGRYQILRSVHQTLWPGTSRTKPNLVGKNVIGHRHMPQHMILWRIIEDFHFVSF